MKDFIVFICVFVLGYLGYQLFIEDKSLQQVKKEVKTKVSHSQYIAKELLEAKISKLPTYKKAQFGYNNIQCFDYNVYGISCNVEGIYGNNNDRSPINGFDVTLYGVNSLIKHKFGLYTLNNTKVGIKISNIKSNDLENLALENSQLKKLIQRYFFI